MKNYDAYVFDLYGTLVDIHTDETQPKVWKILSRRFRDHGADYTDKELRKCYLQEIKSDEAQIRIKKQIENENILYPEPDLARVLHCLFRNRGVNADDSLIAETASALRDAAMCHIRLYAGVREMLQSLKKAGKKVILLSNAQRLFTIPEMDKLGILDGYFDEILISSDIGAKKPDPYFYRQLFCKEDLIPEKCLMIGNDLRCDIEGAKEAGMDAFYILSGLSPAADKEKVRSGQKTAADYIQIGMNWRRIIKTDYFM
ncbi:MAG: HAD family hydrolase [Lachnospiraceae bacterium]|nr:HAD family hydrolase [Lachnospiraceae bacterium]